MFYTIYKITNLINNKYYIGKHQTKKLDDEYLGSGKLIKRAIIKYGLCNFTKEILYVFETEEEMNAKEKELVVICEQSYNLCDGGNGGFSYINREKINNSNKNKEEINEKISKSLIGKKCPHTTSMLRRRHENGELRHIYFGCKEHNEKYMQLASTPVAIAKRKDTYSQIGHQQGSKNSQFGKMWIYNEITRQSRSILKTELIPKGWAKGRKIN